jgi:phage-related protein
VAGVGLAIGKLVFDTATASAELVDLSAKTGISTERLQEMEYIGEQVGTSQDTIVSSMARLVRSMGSAQQQQADFNQDREEALAAGEEFDGQLGDTASAFDKLGVKVTDAGGKLRDNEAVFADVITALGRIPNEAERDALSMELFGKSAQELNPLIKAGSAEMARLAQESHEVGAVMSGENVAAFEELDDTVASLKAGLKGTLGTLAASFLPGFQSLFDELGGYLKGFKGIVESSDGDIAKMAEGIGKLAARIVSDIAAQAPQLLQTGVVILQSIVQSLISALPSLIPAAIEIVVSLLEFILDNLPLLVEAALQAVIALANGLSEALPRLIPAIIEALILIVNTIVENLPLLVEAATQLILGLTKGILIALPILIEALPQVIEAIVLALIEAAPLLLSAAGQLLGMLAAGIVLAIPQVLVAIGDLIYRLGLALAEFWEQAPEIGKALIQGLWQGIVDAVPFFLDNLRTFGNKVVNEFQSIFGVQSPSTVFADDIGKYLLPGLTKGVENSIPSARRQLEQTISALTNNLQLGLPGIGTNVPQTSLAGAAAGSVTNSNTSNQNVTINISATVRGQQDIDYMAQEVARRIAKP